MDWQLKTTIVREPKQKLVKKFEASRPTASCNTSFKRDQHYIANAARTDIRFAYDVSL